MSMGWAESLKETVQLMVKTPTGEDPFGVPTYAETWKDVKGVLVGNVTSVDQVEQLNLTGKKISYILCIPKGDANEWEDKDVIIRGEKFRTVGLIKEYREEALPPLPWNRQIGVERYV